MTTRKRIAISAAIGLLLAAFVFLTMGIADGVYYCLPFSPQYFVLKLMFPFFKIHEDEMGTVQGWLWLFVIPWLAWTVALYLLMYVMRKDRRAA